MSESSVSVLEMNERLHSFGGVTALTVTPERTGDYILSAFSKADVYCEITSGAEVIGSGVLPVTVTLREGINTHVLLRSEEAYTFEVNRASHGRNVYSPIELSEGKIDRTLARAYDVHYYKYTALSDGEVLLYTKKSIRSGVNTIVEALSPNGTMLAEPFTSEDTEGAFVYLNAGEVCLLRVSANGSETGNYSVHVKTSYEQAAPETLGFTDSSFALETGQFMYLHPSFTPDDALNHFLYSSSAPSVASVNGDGIITARGEGTAEITVSGFGGIQARVLITVEPANLTGIRFYDASITAIVGDTVYPGWAFEPVYAPSAPVTLVSLNEDVVQVTEEGLLFAAGEGEAAVILSVDGTDFSDTVTVIVQKPAPIRRALTVGISVYADGRVRTGCVNTTQGVLDALTQEKFSKSNYLTNMQLDLSKKELLKAIETTFKGAVENDISLFYINCHGNTSNGLAWLEMYDGERLYAFELERALRKIDGVVIVLIDCCSSGAFIGNESAAKSPFADDVIRAFSGGNPLKNSFASSKYKVIVSSSFNQNSYRIASSPPASESTMSTVFARALTEGLGWNLIKDKPGSMKADLDKNRQITLHEAWLYAMKRCNYYLKNSSARQTVHLWPQGDSFIIVE